MKSTSSLISRILAIFIVLPLLLGAQPALPALADEPNMSLIVNGGFTWAKAIEGTALVQNNDDSHFQSSNWQTDIETLELAYELAASATPSYWC